ncbi:hypothetical protein ASZ90_017072 [hydrocarbon metagenome]|uniref:Uncharacterized protein n=1 Tax=hydrocarbon metagenome TaxID=938273 RepID=A0A0W8EA64_9ZZZZ
MCDFPGITVYRSFTLLPPLQQLLPNGFLPVRGSSLFPLVSGHIRLQDTPGDGGPGLQRPSPGFPECESREKRESISLFFSAPARGMAANPT